MSDPGVTQSTDERLPSPVSLAAALASPGIDSSSVQFQIGKYRLKDPPVGGGGMGVVFEAIHGDLGHSVALKLMKHGAASGEALDRFIREAKVLASCHHPGIAQVYDAGTHRQGEQEIPYYVMEFVRGGRTITRYAAEKHLSIDQRLELFARVCDAMQSVHDLGIIHRDIKPENILIDSAGQPKVIDFGVARVLNADLPLPASQTAADSLLGTLPYMSPEQTGSEGGHIDKRSDVYSLGVVLYELLCGRLPYIIKDKRLDDAIRIIREVPPAKPHDVNPALDEDVETILLKSLHKDRERRYESAAALAADIRHRLAQEPIDARRDSATYVLRKRAGALVAAHKFSMWLMVTIGALLAAEAIGAALDRWTPMHLFFERTVTSRIAPAGFVPFQKVRMIAMQDGTDFDALAKAQGLEGVNSADNVTLRRLHGRLMQKLADSGARVVVFDIFFPKPRTPGEPCRFEQDLLAGIRALRDVGCDVVVAAGGKWDVGEDDLAASICPAIARQTKWGFTTAQLAANVPWSLDLLLTPVERAPMPSLALAASASYWRPGLHHWVSIDVDRSSATAYAKINYSRTDAARPRAWGAPAESFSDRVLIWQVALVPYDIPERGQRADDFMAHYILHVPTDTQIRTATIDYTDVLSASREQLRIWFEGKAVVIGDARAGRDGPHPVPDGRKYNGFIAHAIGIDSILSQNSIVAPPWTRLLGARFNAGYLFDAAGVLAGSLLALVVARPEWRRRALTALVVLLIGVVSVLIYRLERVLYDPTVAAMGAVIGAEIVSWSGVLRSK